MLYSGAFFHQPDSDRMSWICRKEVKKPATPSLRPWCFDLLQ